MEEENRKPKALTKEENSKAKVEKVERIFKTKDLVFTAIIAFLIGAIVVAAGFAICGKNRREDFRNFKQDGIQRNIGPGEFNNNQGQNNDNKQNNGTIQRPDMNNGQPNQNQNSNINGQQNAPTAPNNNSQSNPQVDSAMPSNG